MSAPARVPHLAWSLVPDGTYAAAEAGYLAFAAYGADGCWHPIVLGHGSGWIGRKSYVARHQAQAWAERITAGERPPDAEVVGKSRPAITCPPWCTDDHFGETETEFLHMSGMRGVPCAVTKKDAGHICGRTRCFDAPQYEEPFCEDPVFAQIVGDESGVTTIEIGHGDDILPNLTPDAALELAARIAELARLAGAS